VVMTAPLQLKAASRSSGGGLSFIESPFVGMRPPYTTIVVKSSPVCVGDAPLSRWFVSGELTVVLYSCPK
jgi:hypothetical protein